MAGKGCCKWVGKDSRWVEEKHMMWLDFFLHKAQRGKPNILGGPLKQNELGGQLVLLSFDFPMRDHIYPRAVGSLEQLVKDRPLPAKGHGFALLAGVGWFWLFLGWVWLFLVGFGFWLFSVGFGFAWFHVCCDPSWRPWLLTRLVWGPQAPELNRPSSSPRLRIA